MNSDDVANRVKSEGAEPKIFVISASQKLNSDIAIIFRRYLSDRMIDLLIPYEQAKEEILCKIKEYNSAETADEQIWYESPFLETQALISETANLQYEKKADTG